MEDIISRGWADLVARLGGPLTFRLVIQPAVAVFLAIRSGLKDAKVGRPVFFWTVVRNPAERRYLLREGWKDVGTLFIVAVVLDIIYQVIVLRGVYAGRAADRRNHAGRCPVPDGPRLGQPHRRPHPPAATAGRQGVNSHGP